MQNALNYYWHLREQGVSRPAAVEHTSRWFGVSKTDLLKRINGGVANSEATKEALANARSYLHSGGYNGRLAHELLGSLYKAVTGESSQDKPKLRDWCEACADSPAGTRWLCPNILNHEVIS